MPTTSIKNTYHRHIRGYNNYALYWQPIGDIWHRSFPTRLRCTRGISFFFKGGSNLRIGMRSHLDQCFNNGYFSSGQHDFLSHVKAMLSLKKAGQILWMLLVSHLFPLHFAAWKSHIKLKHLNRWTRNILVTLSKRQAQSILVYQSLYIGQFY